MSDTDSLFRWTAGIAINVQPIDQDHMRLFALVEALHNAMLARQGKAALQSLLEELVNYTCEHFSREEKLMEQVAYPAYREHKEEHEKFRNTITSLQQRHNGGETTMTIEVMGVLAHWLKHHISSSDRAIGQFIQSSPEHQQTDSGNLADYNTFSRKGSRSAH